MVEHSVYIPINLPEVAIRIRAVHLKGNALSGSGCDVRPSGRDAGNGGRLVGYAHVPKQPVGQTQQVYGYGRDGGVARAETAAPGSAANKPRNRYRLVVHSVYIPINLPEVAIRIRAVHLESDALAGSGCNVRPAGRDAGNGGRLVGYAHVPKQPVGQTRQVLHYG